MFDYDRYNYEEYLTQLADDLTPQLSGDLDGQSFYDLINFVTGTFGTLTIGSGSITDTGGTIDFGDETLWTRGRGQFGYTGVWVRDSIDENYLALQVYPGTVGAANRTLNFDVGGGSREITLTGNPTLADWFDQSVKQAASPIYASGVTIGNLTLADGSITDSGGTISFGNENLTTTGIITGKHIIISDPTPILVFKDSIYAGDASLGFMEWRDSNNTRLGFFGNSSSGNDDLLWKNESSGGHIGIQTTGGGEVQISANLTISGTNEINFRDTNISMGSTLADGILDISADSSIRMFYDNADVGDAVAGQYFYIYRRAAEGDDYIRFQVDADRAAGIDSNRSWYFFVAGIWRVALGASGLNVRNAITAGEDINTSGAYKVDTVQVVGNRVIDARCDDALNSGDATTDGVIDSLRDAMITHGLIAAA